MTLSPLLYPHYSPHSAPSKCWRSLCPTCTIKVSWWLNKNTHFDIRQSSPAALKVLHASEIRKNVWNFLSSIAIISMVKVVWRPQYFGQLIKTGVSLNVPCVLRWFVHIKSFLVFIIHEECFMTNHQIATYEHLYTVKKNNREMISWWLEPQGSIQTVQSC